MNIKIISDFHAEFWCSHGYNPAKFKRILERVLPPTDQDAETVLCCAGDMGTYSTYATSYKPLFRELGKRFKAVICVPGNHSWYSSSGIWGNEAEVWKGKRLPDNVFYVDNNYKVLDGVMFIGSCLWTSFEGDPLAAWQAQRNMNDYVTIKKHQTVVSPYSEGFGAVRLCPEDTILRHKESVEFLKTALGRAKIGQFPAVVITHHAPSEQSVANKYSGSLLNHAYYTPLEYLIEEYKPVVWCHGHMHDNKGYEIGETKIICNPYGYHAYEENKHFNPNLTLTIDK